MTEQGFDPGLSDPEAHTYDSYTGTDFPLFARESAHVPTTHFLNRDVEGIGPVFTVTSLMRIAASCRNCFTLNYQMLWLPTLMSNEDKIANKSATCTHQVTLCMHVNKA